MNIPRLIVSSALLLIAGWNADAASPQPLRAKHGMVVSANRLASEVGVKILKRGGNAVDAAVAVGFVLAVFYPEAGNIGGGGFMLIRNHNGEIASIDFREKAPGAATRTMYLDSAGNVTGKNVSGPLSSAVPGTVAGLLLALQKFGTMDLRELIQPAIDYAEQGFIVDRRLSDNLLTYADSLSHYSSTLSVFSKAGKWCAEGETLRQPDLAITMRRIQRDGTNGFYRGETAHLLVEEMNRGNGLITTEDLENYRAVTRTPLRGSYRGFEIVSMPLPSSGGICLMELLNTVEGYDLASMGFHSSAVVHVMSEAMKNVFADRAEFMGDPDFVDVPVDRLISKTYADDRRREIDSARSRPAGQVHHGGVRQGEGENTTNFVVVDSSGGVVSVNYTLNDLFGNKIIVSGAGFFLNDEMDDFSAKPGVPNIYGLIGGDANAIEAGKRPLSSMVPTLVLKDGIPVMALGARGGSKIISAVFQSIVNVIDFGMNIQEAVDLPRFHHQWFPDTLLYEKFCMPREVTENLQLKGYTLRELTSTLGHVNAVFIDRQRGWIYGGPDSREGGVAVGY